MRRVIGSMVLVMGVSLIVMPASAGWTTLPDGAAWRAAAEAGTTLEVLVAGERLRLDLRPDLDLLAPGAAVTGPGGDVVPVMLVEGDVVGSPGWVRVTLRDRAVYGMLATPQTGLVSIAPRADGAIAAVRSADVTRLLRAAGIDTRIDPQPERFSVDCDSLSWTPEFAEPSAIVDGASLRTFDVAVAVDSSFVALHPSDWTAVALSFMQAIDQLFRDAFDVRIELVHLVAIDDDDIPGTTTDVVLDSLQDHYVATYPTLERDNVHLFTGRDMTNAGGQVNCVGSAGRTAVSYSVAEGNPGGPYNWFGVVLLPDGAVKIGAHELAHTLSAHHHYANCAESIPGYDAFLALDACTIMINDWGLIQPVFSTVSRLAVRGWADRYDI